MKSIGLLKKIKDNKNPVFFFLFILVCLNLFAHQIH